MGSLSVIVLKLERVFGGENRRYRPRRQTNTQSQAKGNHSERRKKPAILSETGCADKGRNRRPCGNPVDERKTRRRSWTRRRSPRQLSFQSVGSSQQFPNRGQERLIETEPSASGKPERFYVTLVEDAEAEPRVPIPQALPLKEQHDNDLSRLRQIRPAAARLF